MNQDFAAFVREASFHLTLSESMILSILSVDRDIKVLKKPYGLICSRSTSNALYRRGMVIPSHHNSVPKEWIEAEHPSAYELTKVGELMAELLREAGFKTWDIPPVVEESVPEVIVTLK